MLLRGSSSRNARGSTPNRSSNRSRGQGSTSRGASSSSSKSKHENPNPTGPRAMHDSSNTYHTSYRGKNFKNNHSSQNRTGTSSSGPNSPNPFEQERIENAAKRMQRGQNGTMVNGRGGRGTPRGGPNNKQVRFADPPAEPKQDPFAASTSTTTTNPFSPSPTANFSPFGSPKPPAFNPFAPQSKTNPPANPFGAPSPIANPFGAPSQPSTSQPTSSVFGAPSPAANPFSAPSQPTSSAFGTPSGFTFGAVPPNSSDKRSPSVFGAPSASTSNPFEPVQSKTNGISTPSSSFNTSNPFDAPSTSIFSGQSMTPTNTSPSVFVTPNSSTSAEKPKNPFGSTNASNTKWNSNDAASKAAQSRSFSKPTAFAPSKPQLQFTPQIYSNGPSGTLAEKIDQLLRKERIFPPSWPAQVGGKYNDPVMIKLYNDYKAYRAKVRAVLIRAGLLDDPDKPKKLSEALEFKGTCEDMCPDFERASRIMDLRIDPSELDGGLPSQTKMVKALARSAAGQDAPLPSDIRTAAALRRTVDHLFRDVLNDRSLPNVHGFLWDRTRAIRRDFVFHSSMTPTELVDQVYCLEHITRFHVIALHQMVKENLGDKFVEQQELEQLGKTLLSLVHAYEDCNTQRVPCENEAEFRAYYVLFNCHDPGILDTVQTWGWKFWESEDISIAVKLVETLQNTWDLHGPLKPHSATDIAQNGFSRFFTIIEDRKISYTLACFAEIFFNDVRKSVLTTILGSYRKQRDQTKDWTLSRLNSYLRFDEEEDVVPFVEAHGLRIDEVDGEEYLSFEMTDVLDPSPKLHQTHSQNIVERKRGTYSLSEVIDRTVFDESTSEEHVEEEEEEGLFVNDDSIPAQPLPKPVAFPDIVEEAERDSNAPNPNANQPASIPENGSNPKSIFERMESPKSFGTSFFTPKAPENSTTAQAGSAKTEASSIFAKHPASKAPISTTPPVAGTASLFPQQPQKEAQSIFTQSPKEPANLNSPPIFSPPRQPITESSTATLQAPLSFGPVASGTSQDTKETVFPAQQPIATNSLPVMGNTQPTKNDQPMSPFIYPSNPSTFFSTPQNSTPTPSSNESLSQDRPQSALSDVPQTLPTKASLEESAAAEPKPLFSAKPPAPLDREKQFTALSEWITLGEDGLLDQFTAFHVEEILRQTAQMFMEEEAARAAREADDSARMEADRFRYRTLATKYGYRWREMAHRLWLKRKGREARQARREMAESMRSSKAAQSANIVEDFKASTTVRRRDSLKSLLGATGVLNGVHAPDDEIQAIVREEQAESSHKRQRSERSSTSIASSTNRHKRGKSGNPLRRSILSDPSYLNGGSRIHLMSKYGAQEEGRRQVSGVQTDYFRLKARGITTLPDGTPLANSAARNIVHQKRSFDGIQKPSTPQSSKYQPVARSVPAKFATHAQTLVDGNDREDLEALKIRAKDFVLEEKKSRQKRTFVDDDEELFERAKRIREQMDEGASWYRKEIERETASRSVS